MTYRPLFHYTTGERLKEILRDQEIKPATANVDTSSERPVVWCTFSREWEPTCNKGWADPRTGQVRRLSTCETAQRGGGLFRIEVEEGAAPHNWKAFRHLSGCNALPNKAGSRVTGFERCPALPTGKRCCFRAEVQLCFRIVSGMT